MQVWIVRIYLRIYYRNQRKTVLITYNQDALTIRIFNGNESISELKNHD